MLVIQVVGLVKAKDTTRRPPAPEILRSVRLTWVANPGYPFLKTGPLHDNPFFNHRRCTMPDSTYKIIELVGTSEKSWEDAARTAVETAGESLKELRIAEVTKLDVTVEKGKVKYFRARVSVSFKYMKGD
jgi:dodecin